MTNSPLSASSRPHYVRPDRLCLNGEWAFMPDFEGRSPTDLLASPQWEAQPVRVPSSWRWMIKPHEPFQPYDMFGYPAAWNDAQAGMLGRSFTVEPQGDARVWLVFEGILQEWVIFVNGVRVAAGSESFLPIEVDVTAHVRLGEANELAVWCGAWRSVATETGPKLLVPEGSWFARLARGIWQDVFLEVRPPVAVEDVFVQTSVRRGEISARVRVSSAERARNRASFEGTVRACVMDSERVVLTLPEQAIVAKPGQAVEIELVQPWRDPILWSPEHPHLYHLRVDLLEEGCLIDQRTVRFGFREVWLDGHTFIINGTRINLRGDAWHYQGFVQQFPEYAANWYRQCKETGINFIRLHAMPYPAFYLDLADEMGMLLVSESAIYGSSKAMAADHPAFLAACHSHLRDFVRRDRNHPSVVIWSMQNEMRWVDGRDGYRAAMPALTAVMKAEDGTRPISYDGDNRLVDPQACEIVSMHYNIDGTVAGWNRQKPLIFGEHGKWHYVAPQVGAEFAGLEAYTSLERCLESIGREEQLFNEYARREEVTGLTPFNTVNYCAWTFPDHGVPLDWPDLATPGPKPRVIPAHTLTVNNGLAAGAPRFRPNPSYAAVQASFRPVAVIANEYDTAFFGGESVRRSFSIYNDTEHAAEVRLTYRLLSATGEDICHGERSGRQQPGEKLEWELTLLLPAVEVVTQVSLRLALCHGERLVWEGDPRPYRIFPSGVRTEPLNLGGRRVACLGAMASCHALAALVPGNVWLPRLPDSLEGFDLLVIGPEFAETEARAAAILEPFVRNGGSLLIMEQGSYLPGELVLSGRKFYNAFPAQPAHPVFTGLAAEDFFQWNRASIHAGDDQWLVQNAFDKPERGDFSLLLECGAGDWGNGGMNWAALLEYRLGRGRVLLNRVELLEHWAQHPVACQLLRNLLEYGATAPAPAESSNTCVIVGPSSQAFLAALGVQFMILPAGGLPETTSLLIADLAALDLAQARVLHGWVRKGGRLVLLPAVPTQAGLLAALLGRPVAITEAPVCQVAPVAAPLTVGITPHDLYLFEKATYTQPPKTNRPVCQHAFDLAGVEPLLQDPHTPWEVYYVRREADEYQKMARATQTMAEPFAPRTYGARLAIGDGEVVLWQVDHRLDSEKVRRGWARLLANLGAGLATELFSYRKAPADLGIPAFMGIARQPYMDEAAMTAYFSDPGFILNNLGEGVYGWMQRQDKRAGRVIVPSSAGQSWFLTVFIESALNRDPEQRGTDVLPDPSLVPDLYLEINRSFRLYLNGRCLADSLAPSTGPAKIEDALLRQGINRLVLVCAAGTEEIRLNAWFKDKLGAFLPDLRYRLTLD
jgi:beta-galactosidase